MNTVIIDVRTEKEFSEGSYPGAINLPIGDFKLSDYLEFRNDNIGLVCFSGARARDVKKFLETEGFQYVTLMQNQMVHIVEEQKATNRTWTIDRQFRLALGMLIGIFLVSNYVFESSIGLMVLIVVFSGLIYSALSDNCYLKSLISLLPWNRNNFRNS
jgi:rhodanese-related sulfurtransferase